MVVVVVPTTIRRVAVGSEQALDTYDGALLLVTHDRRMLENVRLDRVWLVDNGRVADISRRVAMTALRRHDDHDSTWAS